MLKNKNNTFERTMFKLMFRVFEWVDFSLKHWSKNSYFWMKMSKNVKSITRIFFNFFLTNHELFFIIFFALKNSYLIHFIKKKLFFLIIPGKFHLNIRRLHMSWLKSKDQKWWYKFFEDLKVNENFYRD